MDNTHPSKGPSHKPDPWSLYWQADNLDSCIPVAGTDDRLEIDALWQEAARSVTTNANVLDLATGNGTVAVTLCSAVSELCVTAVDKADIDPVRYLSKQEHLAGVKFIGGVDIAQLPFADATFELITSQFGIEYAPRPAALIESCRVLKPNGQLVFLLHHIDSEILGSAAPLREEIDYLTRTTNQSKKLLSTVQDYLSAKATIDELDQAGKHYLAQPHAKTARISGQVFEAINQLVSTPDFDVSGTDGARDTKQAMFNTLSWRLQAEHQRLTELNAAALSEADIDSWVKVLEQNHMKAIDAQRFVVGVNDNNPALVGWLLRATK